jgi:murein DD-endopeptidase MepM/ murein hydrolase activator NlpD
MKYPWPIKGLKTFKSVQISDQKIYISQGFGSNPQTYAQFGMKGHNGLDIAAPTGTPIYTPHDGHITYETDSKGYGGQARIKYKEGVYEYELIFGHMSKFEGGNRDIKEGEILGYVGSTGFSTGPHLHFGVRKLKNGTVLDYNNGFMGYFDPLPFMETTMNQTKVRLSKDGKTVYECRPIAISFEEYKKQASVEGIEVPNPIPPISEL